MWFALEEKLILGGQLTKVLGISGLVQKSLGDGNHGHQEANQLQDLNKGPELGVNWQNRRWRQLNAEIETKESVRVDELEEQAGQQPQHLVRINVSDALKEEVWP